MLQHLFGPRRSRNQGAAAVPDGLRVYAVGDIHGRADLLAALARLMMVDLDRRPVAQARTIFLGDYVDRGPDSRAVLDRLVAADFPTPVTPLRGNHDDIFAGVLRGDIEVASYLGIGGAATLRSYGVDPDALARLTPPRRAEALRAAVPPSHRALLEALELSVTVGDYFFCHAGVRPGVPLDRQSSHDLMWIREEFLHSTADFGKVVVHGHTPMRRPLVRRNGIDVDTKAFASGVLTALVLEGAEQRFLQTA